MARFTNRGNLEVRWMPNTATFATADMSSITAAELAAAINIQHGPGSEGECIADLGGWDLEPSEIEVPDICSLVTGTIPGEIKTGNAFFQYYDDDVSTPSKDLLVAGLQGFVLIMPQGTATGKRGEIWPVKVQSNRADLNVGNEAALFTVRFTTSEPVDFDLVA